MTATASIKNLAGTLSYLVETSSIEDVLCALSEVCSEREDTLRAQIEAMQKLEDARGKIPHDPATCWWCQRAAEIEKAMKAIR